MRVLLNVWLQVSVEFVSPCGSLLLRCSGSSLASPGWLAAWSDWNRITAVTDPADSEQTAAAGGATPGAEDDSSVTDDDDVMAVAAGGKAGKAALSQLLQRLSDGQQVLLTGVLPGQHFTKPPSRFTEASMVKTLEEAGVGRPSTYAPIIKKLLVSPVSHGVGFMSCVG
jgi:DNA topoisomerase-1